jgi:outer membrane protein assembly factor BamB
MDQKNKQVIQEQPTVDATSRIGYQAAVGAALVAGAFSLVVMAVMLANHFSKQSINLGVAVEKPGPLDSAELIEFKKQLLDTPEDEDLKQQAQRLDQQIRSDYFWRVHIANRGRYLLFVGMVVFLIGLKSAIHLRATPSLPPGTPKTQDSETKYMRMARGSVGVVGLSLVGAIIALASLGGDTLLQTGKSTGSEKIIKQSEEPVTAPPSGGLLSQYIVEGGYPSPEEIQKNWPRFRGPGGLGISAFTNIPTQWDGPTGKGILWKAKEDLKPGHNSPIVWEDRIFLSGADICEDPNLVIYSFNANSGELLWKQTYKHAYKADEELELYEDTGFAAPTMATDGKRIYTIFATGDLYTLDFAGNKIWEKNFGVPDSMYGYGTSLAMYKNLLLIQYDQGEDDDEKSVLYVLEGKTGKIILQEIRPVAAAWTSPIVIQTDKNDQIITCSDPMVISYDAATGKELWRADIMGSDVAPSPVYVNGLVFVVQPYDSLFAIRPDGKGDISKTHIAWYAEDGIPDIASPVTNGELIFLLDTGGYITCYETKTGKMIWEDDLGEEFQSSPSVVGENLYLLSRKGVMHIIKAGREFVKVGQSVLGEPSTCSPAFGDGRMYIRGEKHLYCIGNK